MELLYLWVDGFRKFKNTGFTFSSEFHFEGELVNADTVKEALNITVRPKSNSLEIFPSSFLNITGIIGENGTGKSTLLQVIKILSGDVTRLAGRAVFCYRLKKKPNDIHTVYYAGERYKGIILANTKAGLGDSNYKPNLLKPVPYQFVPQKGAGYNSNKIKFKGSEDSLELVTGIFYSNSFETNIEELYSDILNVSNNYLLNIATQAFIKRVTPEMIHEDYILNRQSPHSDLFKDDLIKQIEYIPFAKKHDINLPGGLPESLSISFNKTDYTYLSKAKILKWPKTSLAEIDKRVFEEIVNTKELRDRFLALVRLLALYYVLRQDLIKNSNFEGIDEVVIILENISKSSDVSQAIFDFIRSIKPTKSGKLTEILKVADGTLENALDKTSYVSGENVFRFEFEANDHLWSLLSILFDLKYLDDVSFLDFEWYGISSGQDAYLKLFSRLYKIKDKSLNDYVWIMIDEGELYMHPQWQKDFLNNLVFAIPKIFPNKEIQLFITSHSPFVVSDLPRNNLLLLSSEGTDISDLNIKETFGSNIHTLFRHSFFLRGMLGEFAKLKIDAAIQFLNGEEQTGFVSLDEVQKLVNIIGEPILRNQLQKMIDSKKIAGIHGKVNDLEKRVREIEKKNNKK